MASRCSATPSKCSRNWERIEPAVRLAAPGGAFYTPSVRWLSCIWVPPLVLSATLAGLGACSTTCDRQPAPVATAALPAQFGGCAAVRLGPVCELAPSRTLRVWTPSTRPPVVRFDRAGDGGTGPTVQVDGGNLLTIQVPPGASMVYVEATDTQPVQRAELRVGPSSEPAWVKRAQALRRSGKLEEAEREIPMEAKASAAGEARAAGLMARIALVRGDIDSSIEQFEAAMRKDTEAGLLSHRADDAMALSFVLVQRSFSYSRAREVLDGIPPLVANYPEGWARKSYYRGLLASKVGDWRNALALLRESHARAERLGMKQLQRNSDDALASQLLSMGRTREALAVYKRLWSADRKDTPACDHAVLANNMAFALLSGPESATPEDRREAIALLDKALEQLAGACPDPYRLANARTDRAIAMLQDGKLDAALIDLQKAKKTLPSPSGRIAGWWLEVEGRLALAKHDASGSLRAFEREQELAASLGELTLQWLAALGRGTAFEALGRTSDALRAYEEADAFLDLASEMVPLGEGRALFVGDRTRVAQRRISLLLKQSREREAFSVARQSRARLLRSLHLSNRVRALPPDQARAWEVALADYRRQRDAMSKEMEKDWQLPADKLGPIRLARKVREDKLRASLEQAISILAPVAIGPGSSPLPAEHPDALLVGFHPVTDGWVVFAARGSDLRSVRVRVADTIDPKNLALRLLEGIRPSIESSRRLRFLPYGSLRNVDFHALPWNGAPLVQHAIVEYALDIPAASKEQRPPGQPGLALVVANPTRDLVAAAREGAQVAKALRSVAGMKVRTLEGREANMAAVCDRLPESAFFHYAGHGEARGSEGWESSLPLADGTRLWVSDVLALKQTPSRVVLSACEGAKASSQAPVETLSLAHAFVLAGTQEVIAPTRPVSDAMASKLVARLYEKIAYAPESSLAEVLGTTQIAFAGESEDDWGAFRVLTP
jgi:tetratricopeptide (TPR) repeat protein